MAKITPDLAIKINQCGYEVISMGHAYRVNGVVDIWYNGKTLYDLKANKYINFETPDALVAAALTKVENSVKLDPFKKTKDRGRMSYQEFRNRAAKVNPEYYHWKNDKSFSEDFLYFIQSGPYVKIGRSMDVDRRLKELSTGIAETPTILIKVANKGHMEHKLHRCFESFRVRDKSEWFYLSDDIKVFIDSLRAERIGQPIQ